MKSCESVDIPAYNLRWVAPALRYHDNLPSGGRVLMTPERMKKIRNLFEAALEQDRRGAGKIRRTRQP